MFGWGRRFKMKASTVVHTRRDWNPLGAPTSEALNLGLVAARAAAAVRRQASGAALDSVDVDALEQVQRILVRTARAVEFARTSGSVGEPPSSSFATMTTLELVTEIDPTAVDSDHLASTLNSVLEQLDGVRAGASEVADEVVSFLGALGEAAMRHAGTTGEVTGSF